MSFHTTIARLREAAAARVQGEAPETCRVHREDVRVALHVIDRLDSELRQAGVLTPGAIPTAGLARSEQQEEMQQARAALASAPVAGEAKHDTDSVCAWQVWWNQHKNRYTTTRQASLAAFAAGKEWRGAAPQAREAVRDGGAETSRITPESRANPSDGVVLPKPIQYSPDDGAERALWKDGWNDCVRHAEQLCAALSAQPGAQNKGGSDA